VRVHKKLSPLKWPLTQAERGQVADCETACERWSEVDEACTIVTDVNWQQAQLHIAGDKAVM